jgi:hypothetical protein
MTKVKWILVAAAWLGGIALTGFDQKAADLSGTWVGWTEVPNVGPDEVTLVLNKTEKGYNGTISDNQAVMNSNTEIKDVSIDGEKLSFVFPLSDGSLIITKLVVADDKMTGHWEHPEGTTGTIELVKKK